MEGAGREVARAEDEKVRKGGRDDTREMDGVLVAGDAGCGWDGKRTQWLWNFQ